MKRKGDWFTTYSGIKFYPLDPKEEEVRIEDVAHALSLLCRYGGHSKEFYSVAQHSVHCAEFINERYPNCKDLELWGLSHDFTEAYIGDVIRPLKYSLPGYIEIEHKLDAVVRDGLSIPHPSAADIDAIKYTDNTLLMTERRDFVNHCDHEWSLNVEPWGRKLIAWPSQYAEYRLLNYWEELLA